MVAGDHLEAAVLDRRLVDRDHGADEVARIALPPGLGILVRLEAGTARHLEIDLLLEEDGLLAEKLGDRRPQGRAQPGEASVERRDLLDPVDQGAAGRKPAVLVIDPVPARFFRQRRELLGPTVDQGQVGGVECTGDDDEAVPVEPLDLLAAQHRRLQHPASPIHVPVESAKSNSIALGVFRPGSIGAGKRAAASI